MSIARRHYLLVVLISMLVAGSTWLMARSAASVPLASPAALEVNTGRLGSAFSPGAVGLSIEASELETDHLSAAHSRLVRLMRLLGPSVLRIGGNSVDFSWWTSSGERPPPWATNIVTPADLYSLRKLLTVTGWRVLLGVDLGHFEPLRAADEARYAREIFGGDLLGIEIGNEPNDFGGTKVSLRQSNYAVGEYLHEAEAYLQALSAVSPSLAVYGPTLTQESSWLSQMGATAHMFTELTQHYYPTTTCPGTSSPSVPSPTVTGLLSPAVRRREDKALQALALAGSVAARPTRIGETNSSACGGSAVASPVFASALWSLDWALRAASSGVTGMNFHGGLGFCGAHSYSSICASHDAGEVERQPEYYGLLAARQLEGGRFLPAHLYASDPLPNLTAWATLAPDGTLKIAIDNLAIAGPAQPVHIAVPGYSAIAEETLLGPSVNAKTGITLGGASVTNAGQWHPRSVQVPSEGTPLTAHPFRVVVRPASAVILTFRRRRSRS